MRPTLWLYAALALLAACLPWFGVYPVFMMKLLCFAMFACAYNLILGFARMLSFGHAAFFGSAAYATSWLVTAHAFGPGSAILAGAALAAALGFVIGGLAIRRRGIYFAMITLALGQLVYFVCLEAPFTGGENGLQDVPRGALFGLLPLRSDLTMYYLVLAAFIGVYLCIVRVVHSPFGQVLAAIRENEARATSLGYDINRYRLVAFVLSATLAGFAGALNALVLGFTDAVGRAAGQFRPGDPHDAARRHRHLLRPGGGSGDRGDAAGIPVGPRRWLGDRHHRRHLRRLRAVVPARHRR